MLSIGEIANKWSEAYQGSWLGADPDPENYELFAPKVMVFHNFRTDPVEYDGTALVDGVLERHARTKLLIPDFRAESFKLHVAESAFVFVITSVGTLPDGTLFRIPNAIIWEVEEGKIISLNSVGDHSQRAALDKAYAEMFP